jgi:hypothetical protein
MLYLKKKKIFPVIPILGTNHLILFFASSANLAWQPSDIYCTISKETDDSLTAQYYFY